ncbi:MAG: hypothetical protein OEX04_04760 [Acidimicrobiia bacterium]|nr:hypothetical protein [Acidimicrobiia bacterium]MDH4306768.1 hypothetical protein [Acidimicrobiia bacterium]MDH5293404.1 hypothetical protein [Acidimicrobiia bacterium]
MTRRVPQEWNDDFPDGPGLVFVATARLPDWPTVAGTLRDAYECSKETAGKGESIVYVVHNDDLLGRRGAPAAMVATGLLSAGRTLALEVAKQGASVNVVAIEDDTPVGDVARWCDVLLHGATPTGELIHLGRGHIGKALA